jgi:ABC-2 type transport system permease protein
VRTVLENLYLKTMRDQRRGLVGWSIGVALLVLIEAALWPTIGDMENLEQFLASYPEAMRELFNLDAMTTGQGFMNAELFSMLLPGMFAAFAIGRGARLVAGEEEGGTLDILLVSPLSRSRVLMEKAAALVTGLVALGAVLMVTLVVCSTVFDLGIGVGSAFAGSLSMTLLGLVHGSIAFAVGAVTGSRALSLAVAAVVAVAGYVLHVAAVFVDALQPWQPLSPFTQAVAEGPLGGGVPVEFCWMALTAVVVFALALPVFERRDIAAAH